MLQSLLRTKLYLPPKRSQLVLRPHLTERLNEGLTRKLTLISAPAGFGKTIALSKWISQSSQNVAWLSLDEGDNDLVRFWSYLIAALQTLNANLGLQTMALLQSPQPVPIESVLTILVNEIDTFPEAFALALEDYHSIDRLEIHQAMTFLLDHLPPRMHVYITSRSDPPLPLVQLRAHDELIELRIADLRFTVEETAAFLNQVMKLNLSAGQIAILETRTEGWIAGLQLAALSMRGRDDLSGFIQAFAGSNRFILDYLSEQALARQSQAIQTFLLQTSILDRVSASLCDALTGSDNSQHILEQLEQRNLFILPLDEARQWYRYHQLFADMLRARLHQIDPNAHHRLHQRASAWFAKHNLLSEAVEHALAAEDYEQVAQLIEQIGKKLFNTSTMFPALARWLSKLPDSLVHTRPRLEIIQAWMLINRDESDEAEHCTDIAEQALAQLPIDENTRIIRGEIAALRARHAVNRGLSEQTVAYAQQALIDLEADNSSTRGLVMITLGRGYLLQHDFKRASDACAEAAILGHSAGLPFITLLAAYLQTYLQRALGSVSASIITCRDVLHQVKTHGASIYFEEGIILAGLADLLREQNDLAQALDFANEGVKRCSQLADQGFVILSKLVLARVLQARGELDRAFTVVQETQQFAQEHQIGWGITILTAYEAQLHLIQSSYDSIHATKWLPRPFIVKDPQRFVRDPYLLVYGYEHHRIAPLQFMIVQGRSTADSALLHEAVDLLEQLRQDADTAGLLWLCIKTRLLMALAYDALGNNKLALELLENALVLAQAEGYIRILVDEGEPMRALLEGIATSNITVEYFDQLMSAFQAEPALRKNNQTTLNPSSTSHIYSLTEKLSERELEVLRLIAAGDANQEIADRLVISLATVKRHISNLYGKLAVTSRTQALVRARELKLL